MIHSIPLKKLVPSPRNVRKSSDVLADLQLRADIAARGLLQNLVVRKAKRGRFEVEAGGRRLAALQALAEEGTLPDTHEVTCLVIEGEESEVREASLAENVQRLAMNPADEAQAFASITASKASRVRGSAHLSGWKRSTSRRNAFFASPARGRSSTFSTRESQLLSPSSTSSTRFSSRSCSVHEHVTIVSSSLWMHELLTSSSSTSPAAATASSSEPEDRPEDASVSKGPQGLQLHSSTSNTSKATCSPLTT